MSKNQPEIKPKSEFDESCHTAAEAIKRFNRAIMAGQATMEQMTSKKQVEKLDATK